MGTINFLGMGTINFLGTTFLGLDTINFLGGLVDTNFNNFIGILTPPDNTFLYREIINLHNNFLKKLKPL